MLTRLNTFRVRMAHLAQFILPQRTISIRLNPPSSNRLELSLGTITLLTRTMVTHWDYLLFSTTLGYVSIFTNIRYLLLQTQSNYSRAVFDGTRLLPTSVPVATRTVAILTYS